MNRIGCDAIKNQNEGQKKAKLAQICPFKYDKDKVRRYFFAYIGL